MAKQKGNMTTVLPYNLGCQPLIVVHPILPHAVNQDSSYWADAQADLNLHRVRICQLFGIVK